jgi:hypothetical protein
MAPRTTTPLRLLAAIALTVGAWLASPSLTAQAAPAQVVVEYGATLEAGAKATDTGKSAGRGAGSVGDRVGDVVDQAKQNTPLLIVGIGALMLTGLWKFATR